MEMAFRKIMFMFIINFSSSWPNLTEIGQIAFESVPSKRKLKFEKTELLVSLMHLGNA